ncbi:DUF3857 domain-containing protein [Bacteroidota bacterium]
MNRFILLLTVILNFPNLLSAENQFYIKPKAKWVQEINYDKNFHLYNDNKEDGGTYLLIDFQQNVESQEIYQHFVVRIDEETGIQNYSDLWIDYDPSYQQLQFHELIIHRNKQVLNRLVKDDFNIVQNETELERKIYSGNYSAGINIQDVQVGDIIEYAYTIKGENPIFGGKYFNWFNLEYSVPINKLFLQVTYPKNRPINYKLIESDHQPEKTVKDNQITLKWELNNVEEVVPNSNIPTWYIAFDKVQFSEFASWADVVNWSKPLYKTIDIKDTPLEQKFNELTKGQKNVSKKIDKLIHFVQDEVRYVGIEVNEHSHKPHDPIEVFTKRFGDCKDKSYLLVTLLRHLGVEAWPAYVNSSLKHNINLLLPSPIDFNHVIVAFEHDKQMYFIDPTLSSQRGSFKNVYNGNYRSALVLSDRYNEPVDMPLNSIEKIIIQENIDVTDTLKPAKFSIVSTYYGSEADRIRSTFKNQTLKELKNSYLNFYDFIYPNMRVVDDFKTEDNEKENIFKVYENYEIDKLWNFNNSEGINDYVAYVNATNLEYYVSTPSQKNRTMPFALYSPIEIENHIEFDIHKDISIDEDKGEINNPNFKFTYHVKVKGTTVVFDYTFKTLKDYVSVEELDQYYKDIDKISNLIWYEFTFGDKSELGENGINWLMLVLATFFIIILIFFASKLYQRDIEVASFNQDSLPIGGWLVLPVIGLVISPIVVSYHIITGGYFDNSGWEFISSVDSSGYNVVWSVTFVLELLMNCIFLVYTVFLIVLLFKKRTTFPIHYVSFRVINLLFIIVDAILLTQINSEYFDNTAVDYKNISRAVIGAAIWIPYMLTAQRVKDTFVKKYKKSEIKPNV